MDLTTEIMIKNAVQLLTAFAESPESLTIISTLIGEPLTVSLPEAAKLLGFSVPFLRKNLHHIPHIPMDGTIKFSRAGLLAWSLQNQQVKEGPVDFKDFPINGLNNGRGKRLASLLKAEKERRIA